MFRGQDKLIGKFKMVAGDVISIRGQVLEYMYIPTGIERELVRFGMDGGMNYPYFGTFLST